MLLLLIGLAATPEPPPLRLQLEPGLPCALDTTLTAALAQQQLRFSDEPSAWTLVVRGEGEGVRLRLTNEQGVLRGERRLTLAPEDCGALPGTAALLVKSWLATQLVSTQSEPSKPLPHRQLRKKRQSPLPQNRRPR